MAQGLCESESGAEKRGINMTHGSLFSGIGGFDLAAEWMGWENKFHCEWNDFGKRILNYYWPNSISYDDITKTDFTIHRGQIDVLTGGFPCQPFSTAGEGKGTADERYLWEEMLRAVREIQPNFVIAENVRGITSNKFRNVFETICTSIESEGYQVQPFIIPASAIGAEHQRDRVWFVAYTERFGFSRQGALLGSMQPTQIKNRETDRFINFIQRNAVPYVCDEHYGFPRGLAEQAIHGLGNAIVPQVAYNIFKTIEQFCQP